MWPPRIAPNTMPPKVIWPIKISLLFSVSQIPSEMERSAWPSRRYD